VAFDRSAELQRDGTAIAVEGGHGMDLLCAPAHASLVYVLIEIGAQVSSRKRSAKRAAEFKARKAAIRRSAASPDARWRSQPATERQWKVLRRIGRLTGERFAPGLSRGDASVVIGRRFGSAPDAAAAHARAQRKKAGSGA
jgi:hypothetical protein